MFRGLRRLKLRLAKSEHPRELRTQPQCFITAEHAPNCPPLPAVARAVVMPFKKVYQFFQDDIAQMQEVLETSQHPSILKLRARVDRILRKPRTRADSICRDKLYELGYKPITLIEDVVVSASRRRRAHSPQRAHA